MRVAYLSKEIQGSFSVTTVANFEENGSKEVFYGNFYFSSKENAILLSDYFR